MFLKCRNTLRITKLKSPETIFRRFITSQDVITNENKYLANNYSPVPVVICKGEGVFVYDVEGKRYFDYLAGFSSNNFGHGHPEILEVLHCQSTILYQTSRAMYTTILGEYGKYITNLFGYEKILPMNTGVEACETAVKIARKWGYYCKKIPENKAKMIFVQGNYWGRSIAAVSCSTDPNSYGGYGPYCPGFYTIPYDDLAAAEKALQDPLVCAFMCEPIQGEAGVVIPRDGYLKGIRELCTKNNVLWVDDEIQTGLGRTGKRLAVDYECAKPDILILGKSLAGGVYPVSGCLCNDNIMSVIKPGTHGSTFGGNPLGSKLAIKALEIMERDRIPENSFKLGEIFRCELTKRIKHPVVKQIRGKGLFNAVVTNTDPCYATAWEICLRLKEKGLIAKQTHGVIIRFTPPLTMTEEELCESIEILVDVFNHADKK